MIEVNNLENIVGSLSNMRNIRGSTWEHQTNHGCPRPGSENTGGQLKVLTHQFAKHHNVLNPTINNPTQSPKSPILWMGFQPSQMVGESLAVRQYYVQHKLDEFG